MNIISLEQDNSCFISNTEQDKNFSDLDYISISSYAFRNQESNKCISFLSFNLDLLSCSDIVIHSAKLLMPLEIFKMNTYLSPKKISLSLIVENFSYETLTWNNQPKSTFYQNVSITKNEIKNSCIAIDITSLVCQWVYNNMANYGIKLSIEPPNIMIILPKNKIRYSPKLVVNYSKKEKEDTSPPVLFIRSTNNKSKIIDPDEPIIMNDISVISPSGIDYNIETGIITINKKGYYNFQFEIDIIGTSAFPESSNQLLNMALKNLNTNEIISFHAPEVIPARMHGYGVVHTKNEHEQFILINNSNRILQLADLPYQASLVISLIK